MPESKKQQSKELLIQIQELKEEVKRLKELAYKDELTRLYNRHGFSEEVQKFLKEIISFKRSPERRESFIIKSFSLIIFDIDNFKKLNDTHGHQAGDAALKQIGGIIMESVRNIDLAARWGGEEIVLGLVGASEDDAFRIADDIRKKIMASKIKWKNKSISLTISGGVAGFDTAEHFEDLFGLADKALYKAKKDGKNMVVKAQDLPKQAKKKKDNQSE